MIILKCILNFLKNYPSISLNSIGLDLLCFCLGRDLNKSYHSRSVSHRLISLFMPLMRVVWHVFIILSSPGCAPSFCFTQKHQVRNQSVPRPLPVCLLPPRSEQPSENTSAGPVSCLVMLCFYGRHAKHHQHQGHRPKRFRNCKRK